MASAPRRIPPPGSNRRILAELLAPTPVLPIGFLGRNPLRVRGPERAAKKKLKKPLRGFWLKIILCALVLCESESFGGGKKVENSF